MGDSASDFLPATGAARVAIVGSAAPALDAALARVGLAPQSRAPDALAGVDAVLWLDGPERAEGALVAAGRGGAGLVIGFDPAALDDWGFALGLPRVELEARDEPEALAAALRRVIREPGTAVRENDGDAVRRLRELSDEVARIAAALGRLDPDARAGVADRRGGYRGEGEAAGTPVSAGAIRGMIRARRVRDRHFPDLFADPAWDILLDLLAARLEGRMVAVSSLCIAAAVPPTTALRWIGAMTEQGLLERHADPSDGRRVFIALSDDAARRMQACVAALLANWMPVA